uniref:Pyridoxal phosphate homeostasis protein n=1 Tax=Culicoides sonorensis TaxID=179676 RepID=A0A336M7J2_CULSO
MLKFKSFQRFTMSGTNLNIRKNIENINERIIEAFSKRKPELQTEKPTLICVSKTKPVDLILEAYECGERHFGENYVQELCDKSLDSRILELCPDIKWHFIGHLQTNKINKLLSSKNLYMIQTIDSKKLVDNLNKALTKHERDEKLKVLIQVNTSGEEEKHGVPVSEAPEIYKHVKENCQNLDLQGIMTIGAFGYDLSQGPNPDFISLMEIYNQIKTQNGNEPNLTVSMGMSDDFEHAIELGSSMVRVGSSIFGARQYVK